MQSGEEVTKLLIEWNRGSAVAKDLLVPLLYDEMRAQLQQTTPRSLRVMQFSNQ